MATQNITIKAMWLLYHFGDSSRITAYKKMQRTSLRSKKEKTNLDRATTALMEAATTLGLIDGVNQIISSDIGRANISARITCVSSKGL